ncbi:MAG: transcription antitermination factor NusB [Candidatus Melainabacteria bacterium GWA2_34_9]|nr:MAG: transcription antitermination factor NusB [Candidatus Melainabacteria bacterium GWA2_34_9]
MDTRRTVARELALLTFSQLSKNIEKWENKDIVEIIERSVETLTKEAEHNLQSSVRELGAIRDYIQNYEIDHTDNLERPMDVSIIPVAVPMTSDMIGRIDTLLDAAEKIYSAMDIVQISAMSEREDVKKYSVKLVRTFIENKEHIDAQIKEHSKGWDVDRLLKVDRDVLRISITELLYFEDIPASVSIDEAVELSKKYGTDESSSFINGILRQVYEARKFIK